MLGATPPCPPACTPSPTSAAVLTPGEPASSTEEERLAKKRICKELSDLDVFP